MSVAPQIKGWCPSAWRPMLTGDGYLVRLHFSCGIVTSDQARAIARLSQAHGNGLIDLTRRANLQIRGVSEEHIPELQAELVGENLIAEDAAAETVPNVIASPLAGRDREALIDIRPVVRELERHLASDLHARDLPAKFCITVDDGGRFSLRDIDADISFEACQHDCFTVRVADVSVDSVQPDRLWEAARELIQTLVAMREQSASPARRTRDLIAAAGIDAIASCPALSRASTVVRSAYRNVDRRVRAGADAVGRIDSALFGAGVPFGSLQAEQIAVLADLAHRYAEGEVRLTPWRSIFIPGIVAGASGGIQQTCARAGLVTDASDAQRRAAACPGAPGCASASVETRAVAAALAPLLAEQATLHVSGCAKGCASSRPATITLVGREGRYDLVHNGKASDRPSLFGLTAAAARTAVERMASEELAHV